MCLCLTQTGKQCTRKPIEGRRFCKQHDQEFVTKKVKIQKTKTPSRETVKVINKLPVLKAVVETERPKSAFRKTGSPSRGSIKFNTTEDVVVFKRGVNKPGLVIIDHKRSPSR
jgi:hypothetical protein